MTAAAAVFKTFARLRQEEIRLHRRLADCMEKQEASQGQMVRLINQQQKQPKPLNGNGRK